MGFLFLLSLLLHVSTPLRHVTLFAIRFTTRSFSTRLYHDCLYTCQDVRLRSEERVRCRESGWCPSFSVCKIHGADTFLQTVVITGGSDGMGRAVAMQLAEKGANVVIVARTVSKLQAALEGITVSGCFELA